jgi:CRP-like cAMP-binding protein
MTDLEILLAFRHVDVLKNLPIEHQEILASFSAFRNVRKGETLFCQGEPSPYCFGILKGEVVLAHRTTAGAPVSIPVATYKMGSLLEGLSLLGEMPRAMQATVSEDGQLLSIWSSRFRAWVETQRSPAGDPPIVSALRQVLNFGHNG